MQQSVVRVHWSFWILGAAALVFNLLGCVNFISQMNADFVARMPDAYRSMIETRPQWATAAFAIAVFGGALGCGLLLLRKSVAYPVFVVSLLGAIGVQLPVLGMAGFPVEAHVGWAVQVLVTGFMIWYARRARHKGWVSR